MDATALRDGIFSLHTRRFGSIPELIVRALAQLGEARNQFHDLYDDLNDHRVEVKFSRVLHQNEVPVKPGSLLAAIDGARPPERMVAREEAEQTAWDCNIQQVKRAEFDVLYYGLFFSDLVVCFRATSEDVPTIGGYSDFQHKGNVGEGQFHLKPTNFSDHMQRFHYANLDYDQVLESLAHLDQAQDENSN